MKSQHILPAALLPLLAAAQSEGTLLGASTAAATSLPTGEAFGDLAQTTNLTYMSYTSTITLSSSAAGTTLAANATLTTSNQTELSGMAGATSSTNGTASRTSSAARPSNTQECNGYVDFCFRPYSNLTHVAAHNFPFTTKNNAARNQEYGITEQLNDGIRMLQVQSHWINDTMQLCHTSCDLLNAGTLASQFEKLVQWLEEHPYEIVTLLIGNYDQTDVRNFVPAVQSSGLEQYLYTPPKIPMALGDWPTLGEMIITRKRVVFFMDYKADPTEVPYILDEFSQMWETPFSPTDPAFPCTQDRPPHLPREQALDRLYLANHNLNVDFSGLGVNLLVPDVSSINQTNAAQGNTSLAVAADRCTADWGRPPNFLLVDFYNRGNFPGSVFQVAAAMNNVTYKAAPCCGKSQRNAAKRVTSSAPLIFSVGIALLALWVS